MASSASARDPSPLKVFLTLALGKILARSFYRGYVHSLDLRGDEVVLEYGSGAGMCSRYLAERLKNGGRLTCVDASRGWVETARRTLRRFPHVSYALGRVAELDLPDEGFDVVFLHFALHEIPAAERAGIVQTLARKLRPGGRLYQREPRDRGLALEEMRGLLRAAGLQERFFLLENAWLGGEMFRLEYVKPVRASV